ncbi:endonuclease/exonuclease/phosphatase family protein [Streptomyces sp. NPDC085481]|uniref:endonuclease/exonuclease/phosphatase family protein n=1 Tax=Streptomyces sp. NPDC085481 TaxID=3365727 RepID=UPI0037D58A6A
MVRRRLGSVLAAVAVAGLVYAGAAVRDSAGQESAQGPTVGATTSSVRVLTWNVCGESGSCRAQDQAEQQAVRIANLAASQNADAVFLQEVCGEEAKNDVAYDGSKKASTSLVTLVDGKLGEGWSVAFLPYTRPAESRFGGSVPVAPSVAPSYPPRYQNPQATSDFRCRGPLLVGVQGIAVAVKGETGEPEEFELHSPKAGLFLKALCVRRAGSAPVRFCTSHLTPQSEDLDSRAGFSYRAEQVQRLGELVGDGHDTVFGGDFNSRPPDDPSVGADRNILAPLYGKYRECEQGASGTARKGSGTMWDDTDQDLRTDRKYDYLFSKSSFSSCQVLSDPALAAWSDHLPVLGTVPVTTG